MLERLDQQIERARTIPSTWRRSRATAWVADARPPRPPAARHAAPHVPRRPLREVGPNEPAAGCDASIHLLCGLALAGVLAAFADAALRNAGHNPRSTSTPKREGRQHAARRRDALAAAPGPGRGHARHGPLHGHADSLQLRRDQNGQVLFKGSWTSTWTRTWTRCWPPRCTASSPSSAGVDASIRFLEAEMLDKLRSRPRPEDRRRARALYQGREDMLVDCRSARRPR